MKAQVGVRFCGVDMSLTRVLRRGAKPKSGIEKGISAGHVGDATSVTSWTPLKITHLRCVEYLTNTPRQLHRGHPDGDLRYRRVRVHVRGVRRPRRRITMGARHVRRRAQVAARCIVMRHHPPHRIVRICRWVDRRAGFAVAVRRRRVVTNVCLSMWGCVLAIRTPAPQVAQELGRRSVVIALRPACKPAE
jgi:hypothetical protein